MLLKSNIKIDANQRFTMSYIGGYDDILRFVADMKENEGMQLQIFGKFLVANNLVQFLKKHEWAEFARLYNGPGYKKNKYDIKLERAYKKYAE